MVEPYQSNPGYTAHTVEYQPLQDIAGILKQILSGMMFPNMQTYAPTGMLQYDFQKIQEETAIRGRMRSDYKSFNPVAISMASGMLDSITGMGRDKAMGIMVDPNGTPNYLGKMVSDSFNAFFRQSNNTFQQQGESEVMVRDALKGLYLNKESSSRYGGGISAEESREVVSEIMRGTYKDDPYLLKQRGRYSGADMIETLRIGRDYGVFKGATSKEIAAKTLNFAEVLNYGQGVFETDSKEEALKAILDITGGGIALNDTGKLKSMLGNVKNLAESANLSVQLLKQVLERGQEVGKQLNMGGVASTNFDIHALNNLRLASMPVADQNKKAALEGYQATTPIGERDMRDTYTDYLKIDYSRSQHKQTWGTLMAMARKYNDPELVTDIADEARSSNVLTSDMTKIWMGKLTKAYKKTHDTASLSENSIDTNLQSEVYNNYAEGKKVFSELLGADQGYSIVRDVLASIPALNDYDKGTQKLIGLKDMTKPEGLAELKKMTPTVKHMLGMVINENTRTATGQSMDPAKLENMVETLMKDFVTYPESVKQREVEKKLNALQDVQRVYAEQNSTGETPTINKILSAYISSKSGIDNILASSYTVTDIGGVKHDTALSADLLKLKKAFGGKDITQDQLRMVAGGNQSGIFTDLTPEEQTKFNEWVSKFPGKISLSDLAGYSGGLSKAFVMATQSDKFILDPAVRKLANSVQDKLGVLQTRLTSTPEIDGAMRILEQGHLTVDMRKALTEIDPSKLDTTELNTEVIAKLKGKVLSNTGFKEFEGMLSTAIGGVDSATLLSTDYKERMKQQAGYLKAVAPEHVALTTLAALYGNESMLTPASKIDSGDTPVYDKLLSGDTVKDLTDAQKANWEFIQKRSGIDISRAKTLEELKTRLKVSAAAGNAAATEAQYFLFGEGNITSPMLSQAQTLANQIAASKGQTTQELNQLLVTSPETFMGIAQRGDYSAEEYAEAQKAVAGVTSEQKSKLTMYNTLLNLPAAVAKTWGLTDQKKIGTYLGAWLASGEKLEKIDYSKVTDVGGATEQDKNAVNELGKLVTNLSYEDSLKFIKATNSGRKELLTKMIGDKGAQSTSIAGESTTYNALVAGVSGSDKAMALMTNKMIERLDKAKEEEAGMDKMLKKLGDVTSILDVMKTKFSGIVEAGRVKTTIW